MTKTAEATRAEQGQAARTALLAKLQRKRPQSASYDVVLDPGPLQELADAQQELSRAELFAESNPQGVEDARARVAAAEPAAQEATLTLHFRGLGRVEYEQLLLQHPPTEEQKTRDEAYDLESFLPALLAATIVAGPDSDERPLTPEDVSALIAEWNQGEVGELWARATMVCTQARNPALPFGSARTRGWR